MRTIPVAGDAPPTDPPAERDFDECYATRFRPIAGQLTVYLGSVEEAQEVTQEAFVRAWTRWHRICRYDDPAAWVRRVAWNLATSRLRRMRVALRYRQAQRPDDSTEENTDA
jgi:RNA polymerase sigma-70 factor (ECF subfamily)